MNLEPEFINLKELRLITQLSGRQPSPFKVQWYSHPARPGLREQREVPGRDGDVHEQRGALHNTPLRLRGCYGQGSSRLSHVSNLFQRFGAQVEIQSLHMYVF